MFLLCILLKGSGLPVDKVRNNAGRNVAHICCLSGSVKTLHWLFENNSDRLNTDS